MFWNANYVMVIIPQIIYKMEYNKTKAKAYTLPYDTPHQQHMKKVKEITSNVSPTQSDTEAQEVKIWHSSLCLVFLFILQLKYREVYEKSKAQINMDPEAHEIRAAKEAYRNITNVSVFTNVTGNITLCSLSMDF